MAKTEEEIANEDGDTEIDLEDEEQDDESDEEEEESDSDSDDEDEDEDDDEDDKDSDSDDDSKPLTRADLNKILSERNRNRSRADRRTSKKDRDTKGKRTDANDARLSSIEKVQQDLLMEREKRTFGNENGLDPAEVDVVYRFTKHPTRKTLRDPVVQGALEGHRTAARVKGNLPSNGSSRSARPSEKDRAKMTQSEKRESFIDRRREIIAGKQR